MKKFEYYVSNPNPFPVQVGDKLVKAFNTNIVRITHEHALELKAKNWTPSRRYRDIEDEMSNLGEAGGDIESLENTLNSHTSNKNNPHEVTPAQIGAATSADISSAINNLNLGTAAQASSSDFATAAQGTKADTAIQQQEEEVEFGSIKLIEAGKGVEFISPDGNTRVLLTIDDSGDPVWTIL